MTAQVECHEISAASVPLTKNPDVPGEVAVGSTTPPSSSPESPLTEPATTNGVAESEGSCAHFKSDEPPTEAQVVLAPANGNDQNPLGTSQVRTVQASSPPPARTSSSPTQSTATRSPDQKSTYHAPHNAPGPEPSAASPPAHESRKLSPLSLTSAHESHPCQQDRPTAPSSVPFQTQNSSVESTVPAPVLEPVPVSTTPRASESGQDPAHKSGINPTAGSLAQAPRASPQTELSEAPAGNVISQLPDTGSSPAPHSAPRLSPSLSPLSSPRTSTSVHEDDLQPADESLDRPGVKLDQLRTTVDSAQSAQALNSKSHPKNHPQNTHQPNSLLHSASPTVTTAPNPMSESEWPVPGSPGSQLTKEQQRFAVSVVKQLKKHRLATPFLRPVDIVALNIPDYPTVIKNPMDLSTIETRLGKVGKPCYYRSVDQFVADVKLVFGNCYAYNGPPDSSQYSRMALDLSIQFDNQMKKMPSEDPSPFASSSRSPSLAKPLPKAKASFGEAPSSTPALTKRKLDSMTEANLNEPAQANGNHKHRSASPQHSRTKRARTLSGIAGDGTHSGQNVGPSAARRVSTNAEPTASGRARREPKEKEHYHEQPVSKVKATTGRRKSSTVTPLLIPNTKAEMKFCKDVLREVNKKVYEKFVWPFYEPVDFVAMNIPDYPKIVKKPMDLRTMKQKLDRGEYNSGDAFADDFRLMLSNCYAYNAPGNPVNNCGKQLESLFEAKWAERPPDLIEAPAPPPEPVAPEPQTADQLKEIQDLQMQLEQLKEKLALKANAAAVAHPASGTAISKKAPGPRASASAKLSSINTTGLPVSGSLGSSTPKSAKANGSNLGKTKAGPGGRRKSGAQSASGAPKRQPPPHEQLLERQNEHRQQVLQQKMQAAAQDGTLPPVLQPRARAAPAEDYFEKINWEQKQDLATQIQNAVEPMQSDAINLIRNSRPDLVAADGEEIELDIDALDDRTLYKLYQLVCNPAPPPKKKKKSLAGGLKPKGTTKTGPRKSHPPSTRPQTQPQPPLSAGGLSALNIDGMPHSWTDSAAPLAHDNGNGTKPKTKRPRASTGQNGGPGRRKAVDQRGSITDAKIHALQQKLNQFESLPINQADQTNCGIETSTMSSAGPNSHPPPAGPIEYASSSSESETESDDDSD